MNNKKKILVVAMVLSMVAILAIGGTIAYFTADDNASNFFTIGDVNIDLIEPGWDNNTPNDPTDGGEGEGEHAYPGEPLAKDPQIVNQGANPCFVRISVTGLDQFVEKYGEDAMIALRWIDEDGVYHDGYNTRDWELYEGYYYYKAVVAAPADAGDEYNVGLTAQTTPVFSQIVIPYAVENNEQTVPVEIYAEAVQAQGARPAYSAVKAMTVEEIAEWFATCMPAV